MMNDQLETELREVFALRAAAVSTDAVERLRRIDYRPHMRRRWPLTISTVGAASGVTAVVSVLMVGGSQAAFAGWTATPATAAGARSAVLSADTADTCQSNLASAPGGSGLGSWNQVATDVRGPYTVTVYQNGSTSLASCFTGPSFTTFQAESLTDGGGMAVALSGSRSVSGSQPPSASSSTGIRLQSGGAIEQLLVSHLSQTGNGAYTLAEGRLASAVSAVTLVLSDGQDVTATTGHGWLVAWWPSGEDVTAAQITTASGTTTEPLNASHVPTPPGPGGSDVPSQDPASGGSLSPAAPLDATG
jgi:hypothetical protein